ncbi:MAG: ankyrin repeat domain-containing protein, partial [Phycisphaerae bacterium]
MTTATRFQDQPATNTPAVTEFMNAVCSGDDALVRTLLQKDPSLLHAYDYRSFGATPLIHAVNRRDRNMVQCLLDAGADIHQRSDWWAGSYGVLPCGDAAFTEFLLSRGAIADAHTLAALNDAEALRMLIADDPQCVHRRGGDGLTPLSHAATPDIAAILLDAGAEIDSRCIDHESTAAQYAAKQRRDVARFLVLHGAMNDIVIATATGDVTALQLLIANDGSLLGNCIRENLFRTSENTNALHIYFYEIGRGATPLHVAAMTNAVQSAEWLISMGANVNARGAYDHATPLHFAAWENQVDVAKALVAGGA